MLASSQAVAAALEAEEARGKAPLDGQDGAETPSSPPKSPVFDGLGFAVVRRGVYVDEAQIGCTT